MLDDPLSVPQPFVPQKQEYDWRTEFWSQTPDLRPTEGREPMATVNVCRYLDGKHEMPPRAWCTHYAVEDETGKRIRPDWSVQED